MDDLAAKRDGALRLFRLALIALLFFSVPFAQPDRFERGLSALKERKFEEAVAIFQALASTQSDRAEVYAMLGVALDGVGQFDRAERAYLKAISLAPRTPGFHNNLALHYQRRGNTKAAIEYFEKELQVVPASAAALFNLSRIYLELDDDAKALEYAEKAQKAHPQDPEIAHTFQHARAKVLAGQRDFVQAEKSFKEALEIGETAALRLDLGWMYYGMTRFEEAEKEVQKAVDLNPSPKTLLSLAYMQIRNSRHAAAERTLSRLIAMEPNSPLAHYYLGIAVEESGRLDEAEKSFRRAIELQPEFAYAFIHLGKLAYERGRYEEALALLQKSIALNPNHAEAHFRLGNVYRQLGQTTKATEAFDRFKKLKRDLFEPPLFP